MHNLTSIEAIPKGKILMKLRADENKRGCPKSPKFSSQTSKSGGKMAKLTLLKGAVPKNHRKMLTRWGFNFFPSAFGTASGTPKT